MRQPARLQRSESESVRHEPGGRGSAYHLDQLALGALGGSLQGGVLTHVVVLAAMTGTFLGLSIWRFSHDD
jgi:hypothetical protein